MFFVIVNMTSIRSLDSGHFWERWIVEGVGKLDFEEYRNCGGKNFTRSILEEYLDEIIENIEFMDKNLGEPAPYGVLVDDLDSIFVLYQVLTYLILKSGSRLPEQVKKEALKSTTTEFDKRWGWAPSVIKIRKIFLEEFRDHILNHKPGKKQCFRQLHIYDDEDLETSSIGLEQFYQNIQSGEIQTIKYVNLDCCDLHEFPEELLVLDHLKTLSMNFNHLTSLPKDIVHLTSLESLYLMDNKIESLPISLYQMSWLKRINLIGNPIFESGKYSSFYPSSKARVIKRAKEFFDYFQETH